MRAVCGHTGRYRQARIETMSSITQQGSPGTVLSINDDMCTFQEANNADLHVSVEILRHSKLLDDLVENSDAEAGTTVPVPMAALQLWISHFSPSQPPQDIHGAFESIDRICELLQVADVLIDESTKEHCTYRVSDMLQQTSKLATADEEALALLPEHLKQAVFAKTPLPHCLTTLPRAWHPIALRAHHPSIDTHATLHLYPLPLPAVKPALLAASAMHTHAHHIHHLSLAGLTLPLPPTPCIAPLRHLPGLTALDVSDIGLRDQAAEALARVLQSLTRLCALDVSRNLFTLAVSQALTPALRTCTDLRSLRMRETVSLSSRDVGSLAMLAAAISTLTRLTALSIGLSKHRPRGGKPPSHGSCSQLFASLEGIPELSELEVDLFHAPGLVSHAQAVLHGLLQLKHVQTLRCIVPEVHSECSHLAPELISALSKVSSLQVDMLSRSEWTGSANVPHASHLAQVSAMISCMATMPFLQRLQVTAFFPDINLGEVSEPSLTLSKVMPAMAHVTSLELCMPPRGDLAIFAPEPSGTSTLAVVDAALRMPALTRLHVPVSTASMHGDMHVSLANALIKALERMTLSIHMFAKTMFRRRSQPTLGPFLPLFPYVRALDIWYKPFISVQPRVEHPLTPFAASMSALTQLTALRVVAEEVRWTGWDNSVWVDVLNRVSCLTSLKALRCCVELGMMYGKLKCPVNGMGDFLEGVQTLRHLSRLEFNLEAMKMKFQFDFLRACAALPELVVLGLGRGLGDWRVAVCKEVLPRLRVRELWASAVYKYDLEHVSQLQHLRWLVTGHGYTDPDGLAPFVAATDLPAFQFVR